MLETFGPHDWVENFRMKKDNGGGCVAGLWPNTSSMTS